ncbi:MAG TPA: hypothetical protein VNG31_02850, partial [Candidatus Baltobacteraceae bacterium]|nr:hypothetical protein [Candidatus Baltobacteraceae bacterium]
TINSGRGGPITPPQRGITLTYRWPTGTIYNHYPQVRFQIDRPVTIGNFHILLDGRDITSGVQYNGQYFYVPVPFSLPMGTHTVRIVGNAARGQRFDRAWTFNQGSY